MANSKEQVDNMVDFIGKRVGNVLTLFTSKKVIVGVTACAILLYATSLPKIIAVGTIAVVYIAVQGIVDAKSQ